MTKIVKDKKELVYIYDAKDILQVSKQRIHQIVKDGTIETHEIAGVLFFDKSDLDQYAKTRKVGRPAKD